MLTSLEVAMFYSLVIATTLCMLLYGHPPITNGYEFLLTFVGGISAVYLFAVHYYDDGAWTACLCSVIKVKKVTIRQCRNIIQYLWT